ADGDGLDGEAGLLLEHGHENVEQPRVLGARGGGEDDVRGLGAGGRIQPQRAQRNEQQANQHETSFLDRYYATRSVRVRRDGIKTCTNTDNSVAKVLLEVPGH